MGADAATGFIVAGPKDIVGGKDPLLRKQQRANELADMVGVTGSTFLGLTVGCARCHDHKKDPIPQEDYYRLLAFFQDVTNMNDRMTRKVMDNVESEKLKEELARKEAHENELYNQIFRIEENFKLALMKKDGLRTATGVRVPDLVELSFKFYRDTWKNLPIST